MMCNMKYCPQVHRAVINFVEEIQDKKKIGYDLNFLFCRAEHATCDHACGMQEGTRSDKSQMP